MRHFSILLLALTLVLGGALAAPPSDNREPAKEKDKPAKVETGDLAFADGSTLRVTLVSEVIEVETRYGKLTIPAAEVQRIDFAFRIPDEVAKKIAAAVKRLGDNNFEEREVATKELREIGRRAYPSLEEAAKGVDAEVAKRASMLLGELREKFTEEDLVFPKKDRVQTPEFTVVGRITASSLRLKTAYFGETALKVADLRSFQGAGLSGDSRLSIDAAKFGSLANQWMETSITLERGGPLKVVASGQVDLWPDDSGQYMTTPRGYGNARPPAFSAGSLVGKIGDNGAPFLIGEKFDGKAGGSGKLYLHIIPSQWGNASKGSYEVKIATGER
jgi:hypothetical protein